MREINMKRILLFLATNVAIMLVLGITASLLGVNHYLTARGLNLGTLLVFAGLMGFGGAFISLETDQPKLSAVRRRRIAAPTTPKPPSIIAQVPGSGTIELAMKAVWMETGTKPFNSSQLLLSLLSTSP